ncbi:MAG: hypothetical protein O9262_06170, partial [Cyclobacteriaceae bacterium]|nr:hypothetical protein [Cyclobacteriaceae bacterium]
METKTMSDFIELPVLQDEESKTELINKACIGRIYPDPQNTRRSIVELNYQSINDAPVHLEVELPYESLR